MQAKELLEALEALGCTASASDDKLKLEGHGGAKLSEELRQEIREHKSELLAMLSEAQADDKKQRLEKLHERIDFGRILLNIARSEGRKWSEGERQLEALEAEYAQLTDNPFSDRRILLAAKRQELELHERLNAQNHAWQEAVESIRKCVADLEDELRDQPYDALRCW